MRPVNLRLGIIDVDGVCLSQTVGAAGDAVINGTLSRGGVAYITANTNLIPSGYEQYFLRIGTAANLSGINFTIYGFDAQGNTIEEVIVGPNATTADSTELYQVVTRVAVDGATVGAFIIGTIGLGETAPIPLDSYISPFQVTISVEAAVGDNIDVEFTNDNVFDPNQNLTWAAVSGMSNLAAPTVATLVSPVSALRVVTQAVVGTVTGSIRQAGLT